mmetsp:Transcript_42829/g.104682  ORF Transcript_42829/g.104682 Transcript_42829/m.104682 type:complete len:226 (-) Transcript_42829:761-1438(-)
MMPEGNTGHTQRKAEQPNPLNTGLLRERQRGSYRILVKSIILSIQRHPDHREQVLVRLRPPEAPRWDPPLLAPQLLLKLVVSLLPVLGLAQPLLELPRAHAHKDLDAQRHFHVERGVDADVPEEHGANRLPPAPVGGRIAVASEVVGLHHFDRGLLVRLKLPPNQHPRGHLEPLGLGRRGELIPPEQQSPFLRLHSPVATVLHAHLLLRGGCGAPRGALLPPALG